MNEVTQDICASCIHDEPNYVSVIGTIPHCCERHWTCKPGGPALEYKPKTSDMKPEKEDELK